MSTLYEDMVALVEKHGADHWIVQELLKSAVLDRSHATFGDACDASGGVEVCVATGQAKGGLGLACLGQRKVIDPKVYPCGYARVEIRPDHIGGLIKWFQTNYAHILREDKS